MKNRTRRASRVLREPLVHFIALGGLLFAASIWQRSDDDEAIVVSRVIQADLARELKDQYGRAPTREEQELALRRWKQEEAIYREGLRQGLDENDPRIRALVISKLLDIQKSLVVLPEPTPEQLDSFLERNRSRYEVPERYDFEHTFASRTEPDAEKRATQMLRELVLGKPASELGDVFRGGRAFTAHTPARIAQLFGPRFRDAVTRLPPGQWTLVESEQGWHAVRVQSAEGGLPAREQLGPRLVQDFQSAAMENAISEYKTQLEKKYDYQIEAMP